MSDVRRVGVEEQDDGVYEVWVDPIGTHYLVPVEEYERLRKVVDVAVRRIAANEPPWFFKTAARTRRLHEDVKRCLYAEALVELEDSDG